MGKTRDLFKKIRDNKGIFHAKMGTIKDRNGMDLTDARGEGVRVISIEPWKQIRASRHVEVGISRSFSHCGRKPWVPSTCAGDLMELLGCL